jgi:hypothetical protein
LVQKERKEGLMTSADATTLMQTSFEAIAAKDLAALSATHHDEVVENFIVLGPIEGKKSVREFFSEFFAAVPDLVFETESIMGVDATTAVGQ